jgi:hypothetical protein
MQMSKKLYTAVTLLMTAGAVNHIPAQASAAQGDAASQKPQGNNFYCNVKALNPAERVSHKQLTDKLVAARNKIVETPKGYEFQFSPSAITIAELADWVAKEGKCCPFFDFHIDLEEEGRLLCLRLTGAEGVKAFVRQEFQVPADK